MTLRPFSADLQKSFRDTLGTPGAPEVIDDGTPVMPVAIVAGTVTATIGSVTATITPIPLTTLTGSRTGGAAGTTTLGTVGAGKIWWVTNAWVISDSIGGGGQDARINLNGVAAIIVPAPKAVTMQPLFGDVNFNPNIVKLTAGQTVTLVSTSAADCYGGVSYYETTA